MNNVLQICKHYIQFSSSKNLLFYVNKISALFNLNMQMRRICARLDCSFLHPPFSWRMFNIVPKIKSHKRNIRF